MSRKESGAAAKIGADKDPLQAIMNDKNMTFMQKMEAAAKLGSHARVAIDQHRQASPNVSKPVKRRIDFDRDYTDNDHGGNEI